ncbi:disulfide bond formation protein B [Muricoccus radiodurans]|uniref:disulfide bond formation protein B n=1 Tax=Muricoccus radiodurans TaxID=2231721 RepID=UPI003CFAC101
MKIRQRATVVAVLAAAAPIAAQASETFLGLAPCALCLWQRWPYWVAAVLAALAAGLRLRGLLALAGLAVLVSGGIAGLHVGVEQGWWPSPLPACSAPSATGAASVEDLMRSLAPLPNKPCDAPAYLIEGLPVTIPMMNLVYALVLGALALIWSARRSDA